MKAQKGCEEIIKFLISEGFRVQVSKKDVEKAIMWTRGVDERTINRWMRALLVFGYLKPAKGELYILNAQSLKPLNPQHVNHSKNRLFNATKAISKEEHDILEVLRRKCPTPQVSEEAKREIDELRRKKHRHRNSNETN